MPQNWNSFYVSDLDGTLLTKEPRLSSFARERLSRLLKEGLPFTVATARSVYSLFSLLSGLEFNLPIITSNGAFLTDFSTGRNLQVNAMESGLCREIYALIIERNLFPIVSTYSEDEERVYYQKVMNGGMEWFISNRETRRDPRLRQVPDYQDALSERVVNLNIMDRKEPLQEFLNELAPFGNVLRMHLMENNYSPGWFWLTIQDVKACKAEAIGQVQRDYGLEILPLTVFGDNTNDVAMFKKADKGVAVSNAEQCVLDIADTVIASHEEDSVPRYILEKEGFV